MPGEWGRDRASVIDSYANIAGVWIIGEDMARETNRVTLHPERKDKFGMPIPNVHVDDHPNDVAMQQHGFQQADALYKSIGAKRTVAPPAVSVHAQHGHQPHVRKAAGRRRQYASASRTTSRIFSYRTAASSYPAAARIPR